MSLESGFHWTVPINWGKNIEQGDTEGLWASRQTFLHFNKADIAIKNVYRVRCEVNRRFLVLMVPEVVERNQHPLTCIKGRKCSPCVAHKWLLGEEVTRYEVL